MIPARLEDARDPARFGGKAIQLGEALRSGLTVPPGFALDWALVAAVAGGDPEAEATVTAAYDELGGAVAVRSSAVGEDSANASFAGQHLSVMNATSVDAVLAAVRAVHASSTTDAALAYRDRVGISEPPRMAVIIQRLVDPVSSGVLFTRDPTTGADVRVIEAAWGLGEAVVAGLVTPDRYRVDRAGQVLEEAYGTKDVAIRLAHDGGTVEVTVPATEAAAACLDREQLLALNELAAGCERAFDDSDGHDIEWAFDASGVHLLQRRPITRLPASGPAAAPSSATAQPATSWEPGARGIFSRNFRLGEWIGEPVTPLFESWLLTAMEERLHEIQAAEFGILAPRPRHVVVNGWYFYSLNFLPVTARGLARSLPTLVARLIRRGRRAAMWIGPLARLGFPVYERKWREELAPRYAAVVREAEATVDSADPIGLVGLIDGLGTLAGEYFSSITVVAGSAYKAEIELARFYDKELRMRIGGSHAPLVAGLTAPQPLPDHAVWTIDWWRPTRGELGLPSTASTADRHAELVRAREAAEASARQALAGSRGRLRAFERRLADAQSTARAREAQVPLFTAPWPVMRRAVRRLGEVTVSAGVIEQADDAYFLTRRELIGAINGSADSLTATLADRRRAHGEAARLTPPLWVGRPPVLVRKLVLEGRSLLGAKPPDERTLVAGVAASAGRATGRVRIVRDPDDRALQPGEILVARVTAPAWTPLFGTAAAVVTDIGSALAHASVIAREYGIPAVVGCGDATTRLRDGEFVTVDGSTGLVEAAPRHD